MKPRKRHDTAYPPTFTIKANGAAVDLTGATVRFVMSKSGTVKVNRACVITNAPGGIVRYDWQASDVDTSGTYKVELAVTFGDGTTATFPSDGNETLTIQDDQDNSA